MLAYLAAFFAALALSLISTRFARGWAERVGIVDRPDGERKTHARPIPRAGGVGIYISLAVVLGVALLLIPRATLPPERITQILATLVGATAIFSLGFIDDAFGLRARTKFAVQIAIAVAMVAAGLSIQGLNLGGAYLAFPAWFSAALTVVWIVGITNAFNLIDGADGVAAGAAVFASGSLAAILILSGNTLAGIAALTLAGATLGFLYFNFPPASIFLGDCGSLLLGFTLAAIGLMSTQAAPTLVAVAIPVVSVGLPILDTLLAMVRRFLRREPIFNADRGHIHHRLRDLGHSPRTITLLMYAVSAAFAAFSLLLLNPDGRVAGTLLCIMGVVIWIALQRLRIPELLEVRRIVDRSLRQRHAIAHNVRIREAVRRLNEANDPFEIDLALHYAFMEGDFVRVHVWMTAPYGDALVSTGHAIEDGRGALWQWCATDVQEAGWELRVPFVDVSGSPLGRLSLWHSAAAPHMLTDMRLVAGELQPALQDALLRLARPSTLPHERPIAIVR